MILLSFYQRKKWYPSLIFTVVIAGQPHYVFNQKPLFHVELRHENMICVMKAPLGFMLRGKLCGCSAAGLPANIRFDGIDHAKFLTTQGRCKICQKNARYMCGKCDVPLHCDKGAACFDMYHTNI